MEERVIEWDIGITINGEKADWDDLDESERESVIESIVGTYEDWTFCIRD